MVLSRKRSEDRVSLAQGEGFGGLSPGQAILFGGGRALRRTLIRKKKIGGFSLYQGA